MSSYIKDFDWEEYQSEDDEKMYDLYDQMEQKDRERTRKKYTKMRGYEGYIDED